MIQPLGNFPGKIPPQKSNLENERDEIHDHLVLSHWKYS